MPYPNKLETSVRDVKEVQADKKLRKTLLICGILSSLLYVAMNMFIPMLWPAYNSASQTVSELSAVGVPTRQIWVLWGIVYTLLVTVFGWGILLSARGNRALRMVGILILAYGIVSFTWPLAPMHQREVLAAGGKTQSDTMHLVLAGVTVLLMTVAMGFGAAAFGKGFRMYSILTILVLLVFGILTSIDAPNVEKNLSTPWAGVWSASILVFSCCGWWLWLWCYCGQKSRLHLKSIKIFNLPAQSVYIHKII